VAPLPPSRHWSLCETAYRNSP